MAYLFYATTTTLIMFMAMAMPLLFISFTLKKIPFCNKCSYYKLTHNILNMSFVALVLYSLIMFYDLYYFRNTVLIHRIIGLTIVLFSYSMSLVSLYFCHNHLLKEGR